MLKSKLYKHQKRNLQFHLRLKRSADFSEQGTGKSLIALSKIAMLKKAGVIDKILVVCPRSVIDVWKKEIEKHTYLSSISLIGSLEEKLDLLTRDSDIYMLCYDSIPGRKTTFGIMLTALLTKGFDFLIGDEVTHIKSYKALRTLAVNELCLTIPNVLFLSGTPISNNPSSIFTLYKALDHRIFGTNFFSSRFKYFKNFGTRWPDWELKPEMSDELTKKMYQIAVRVKKDECLDLPKKVWLPRFTDLTPEQKSLYVPIAKDLLKHINLPAGKVNISNAMTKMSKMSQITSGFVYTTKDTEVFKSNPKLDLLYEVLDEVGDDKVVIYTRWQEDLRLITNLLAKRKVEYETIESTTKDRGKVVDNFQNKPEVKALVSNVSTGGYALTLTASHYIIYYDFNFSIIDFLQSQDRIHRIGQTKTCFYIPLLVKDSIDEYIYDSLMKKVDIAKGISDKEGINRLKENLNAALQK
jgi:SNF2 family DNA or RNA helicase